MSKVTDLRTYVNDSFEQGRSTLVSVPDRLVSLPGGARARAGRSAKDTKYVASSVVSATRRQARINVGLGDAVVSTVAKRGAELPDDARQAVSTVRAAIRQRVDAGAERAAQAQGKLAQIGSDLMNRAGDSLDAARGFTLAGTTSGVLDDVQSRVLRARDGLDKLAERGDQVIDDLRHDPVVARVISNAGRSVEQAANEVTSVAQKLRSRAAAQSERESAAATSTPVRPVAAGQIPTHRTTVRKTPAGQAAISPTPTHRAAAYEVETRRLAAVQAAETRRENAEAAEEATRVRELAAKKAARARKAAADQAAAKRSATALKAAETRKHNAEATEHAAQARKVAALKGAATRKHNAETVEDSSA